MARAMDLLEYEVIWGILVGRWKLDRSLSRSEQVKRGPQPYQPYVGGDYHPAG